LATNLDLVKSDSPLLVLLEKSVEEKHSRRPWSRRRRIATARRNSVCTHSRGRGPVVVANDTVKLPFSTVRSKRRERDSTKEETEKGHPKGPDINRLGDRGSLFSSVVGVVAVFPDDLGSKERGCAGTLGKVGVAHEDSFWSFVLRILPCSGQALSIGEVRDAKVAYLDLTAVGRPQEVGGLDIPVDDTLVMDWGGMLFLGTMEGQRMGVRYSSPRTASLMIRRV